MNNYQNILQTVKKANAVLVVVSKTQSVERIMQIYNQGHRDFGENRVQELMDKVDHLPNDIRWHAIGHLQTNKVKYIAPFIHLIHSVDSLKVWKEINKEALKNDRKIQILLQVKIAKEDSKYGFDASDLPQLLRTGVINQLSHTQVCGLMGMATFTEDMDMVREEFIRLKACFDAIKAEFFNDKDHFKDISMGMSGDYPTALECGSTMLRIGTAVFE